VTKNNDKFLNLRQGTEGIHLEEALRHRRLTRELNDLYTSWGYLPVNTPVFDFYDNYRTFLEGKAGENIYRLMDRDGDLLLLRSDVTLFLARQMGLYLKDADLPLRVSYSDTILRHQNREDISKNEFFQTGVELIGLDGFDGDMEILLLLNRVLGISGIPFHLHLGSRNFYNQLLPDPRLNRAGREPVQTRDRAELTALLKGAFGSGEAGVYSRFLMFIGTDKEFSRLLELEGKVLPPPALKEARYILKVMDHLREVAPEGSFRADLSEIGSQPYHTGIVFQAYMDGIDSAVASGGRYDNLLENFGFRAPSVGFSILLRKIEDLMNRQNRFEAPGKPEKAPGSSLLERYRAAESMRKEGRIVLL